MLVFRAGTHKILVKIANSEDSAQIAFFRSSLICICPVCLDIFGRLVLEILEHLLYLINYKSGSLETWLADK